MTTYLNVPFKQKAEAKAKGARWDSETRKWFVPAGRDLEPFTSWLPVDPSQLVNRELTTGAKGVPLSTLLAGVATAVEQVFRQGVWTTAEVVRADGDPHVYLELAERDAAEPSWPRLGASSGAETSNASSVPFRPRLACDWPPASRC